MALGDDMAAKAIRIDKAAQYLYDALRLLPNEPAYANIAVDLDNAIRYMRAHAADLRLAVDDLRRSNVDMGRGD